MLASMVQEHERGLGGWHAEWETLPEICMLAAGALARGIEVIEGLQVDPRKMRADLDATHGLIMAEAVSMALARHIGRPGAHELVEAACIKAMKGKKHLREVLVAEPRVTKHLSRAQIDRALDPARYLGQADEFVARTLASHRAKRSKGKP
jgi:3-carboxy-cis,cis-muconate cycloisomerase